MNKRVLTLVTLDVGLFVIMALLEPRFVSRANLASLLNNMALEAIMLAAVVMLLVGGQIDLSIDGVIAMAGVVAGVLMQRGAPVALAVLAGVGSALLMGLLNGYVINRWRVNPLITTLATGWIAFGVAYGITSGSSFYGFPASFQALGQANLAGVRVIVLYAVLIISGLHFILEHTILGAHVLIVGDNAEAGYMMGVAVKRVRLLLYLLAGAAAGLVGILLASRLDAATPIAADGLALRTIAAAVVGGCSLAGGYGSLWGAALGLVLISVLANATILLGVPVYWQKAVMGLVLLAAVVLDASGNRLKFKFLRRVKVKTGVKLTILFWLILVVFVGCTALATPAAPAAVPVKDPGKYYFVSANLSDPFYEPGIAGFKAAAEELGVAWQFVGPSDANAAAMMSTLEGLIAAPDTAGIFMYPLEGNTGEPFVKAGLAKGIPMIIGALDSPAKTRTAFIGYDNVLLGQQAAVKAADILGGKGKVGTIGQPVGAVKLRREAFEEYLTAQFPDISIVPTVMYDGSAQGAVKTLDAYLAKNPDLDLLWWADGTSSQMVKPWQEKQAQGVKTKFLAMDMPPPTLQAVKDGIYIGSIGQDTYTEEYWAMRYLYAARHGQRVPSANFLSAIIIDKDNVEQYLK